MKRFKVILARILPLALILGFLGAGPAKAYTTEDMEGRTALAGTSQVLALYCDRNENAADVLTTVLAPLIRMKEDIYTCVVVEDGTETEYPEPKLGLVCTETVTVRETPGAFGTPVAEEAIAHDITVLGERAMNGWLWYKVEVGGNVGYVLSTYVLFDEDAEVWLSNYNAMLRDTTPMPDPIEVTEDWGRIPEEAEKKLVSLIKETNYCLKVDVPEQEAKGAYVNLYAVLCYLLETYQEAVSVAKENGMTELSERLDHDLWAVEMNRERVSFETGKSNDDYWAAIEKEAEAARLAAEEAARQEAYRQAQLMSHQIAVYAASFVGVLPYVYGGCSLTRGADCSGFASQVYAHFGLLDQDMANSHSYYSANMRDLGRKVSIDEIMPGDLVCYNGHVAIYYGNWTVVHAPNPGRKVEYGKLEMMPIITIRRLY